MRDLSRREAIWAAGAAATGFGSVARAQAEAIDEETEAEIESSVAEEIQMIGDAGDYRLVNLPDAVGGEEGFRALMAKGQEYRAPPLDAATREALKTRYWRLPAAQRVSPVWARLERRIDYHHLGGLNPPAAFDLDHRVLAVLAERNSFVFRDRRAVRVIGLRGCALAGGAKATGWATKHALVLADPDHLSLRCLIGLWRPSDGMIRLYVASTVPQVGNMFTSLKTKGWGTSLLPCGLYRFRAGTHKANSPRPQRGALINEGSYVVLRAAKELCYDPFLDTNVWTFGAAHNIHAAGHGFANPRFDSSGCQVLPGWYTADRLRADGSYDDFRRAAGLVGADGLAGPAETAGAGTFEYMLLTGLEASLAAHGGPDFTGYRRLRPGSSGQRVVDMQTKLKRIGKVFGNPVSTSGVFTGPTAFAVLLDQRLNAPEKQYVSPVYVG